MDVDHGPGTDDLVDHGSPGHDMAQAQEPLGPIDWRTWGAALLGAAAAAIAALALYLASHPTN